MKKKMEYNSHPNLFTNTSSPTLSHLLSLAATTTLAVETHTIENVLLAVTQLPENAYMRHRLGVQSAVSREKEKQRGDKDM